MSNVTTATFCRYCKHEILTTHKGSPDRCPECFKIIVKPDNKYFRTPDYLQFQRDKLIEEITSHKIDVTSYDYTDRLNDINDAEAGWCRNALYDDRKASLLDALLYLKHLPYTKSSGEELKTIIHLALKIGELAATLDKLYKSGVSLYDRETRPVRPNPRDTDWDQAAASTGRDLD